MKQKLLKFKMRALMLAVLLVSGVSVAWADTETVTVDKTIASLASANGWEDGESYPSFSLDDFVTISSTGNNSRGKYANSEQLEFYLGDEITISVPDGCTIKTISLKYTKINGCWLKYKNKNFPTSIGNNTTVEASSATLKAGDSGDGINLKEIKVVYTRPATVKLNGSGFATYAHSENLDFTNPDGYTAWQITDVDEEGTITFSQITDKISWTNNGIVTGVLLMGQPNATVNITFYNGGGSLDISSTNKLVGFTADTEIGVNEYYGLKGSAFVPLSAGIVPAGKALLPASAVNGDVKSLNFVFTDETGIREIRTVSVEEAAEIFNLAGQRLQKTQKGVNIVNGKKVLVK